MRTSDKPDWMTEEEYWAHSRGGRGLTKEDLVKKPRKSRKEGVQRKGLAHPCDWDVFTPITPQTQNLMWDMCLACGSWNALGRAAGIHPREVYHIIKIEQKAISQRMLDLLCTASGVGHISDFIWFKPTDLVALGIWKDPAGRTLEEKRRDLARRKSARYYRRKKYGNLPPKKKTKPQRDESRDEEAKIQEEIRRYNFLDDGLEW